MIAYQLSVIPTYETLNYLKQVFKECPFDLDFDSMRVELNLTANPDIVNAVNLDNVYTAIPVNPNRNTVNLGICKVYEPALEMTNLYLPLTCPELYTRANALRFKFKPIFHPIPFLYLCLKRGYHSCIHYNVYVNGISEFFVRYQDSMTFHLETVEELDVTANEDEMIYAENGLR